jgi:hypothetical protein
LGDDLKDIRYQQALVNLDIVDGDDVITICNVVYLSGSSLVVRQLEITLRAVLALSSS